MPCVKIGLLTFFNDIFIVINYKILSGVIVKKIIIIKKSNLKKQQQQPPMLSLKLVFLYVVLIL